ncbi:DUF1996 domain-containing protein (plasmid) [Pseudonocardia sp. DSM 110487]|uniref:DUF1996 domain-containing protein n=1 Tax=Pseudonocardia sp. DSM 110487 TaxID=2865833 RepID=UPI001C6A0DB2|nr:DUF1996 domain-containing protein [Pseudonocardia sp. DSM 110487]QYN41061.1 DUF1996 domain-containing protein [Pseudonocardia sp. DSM 110487]
MRSPVSRTARWAGALALAVIVAIAVFGSGGASGAAEAPAAPAAAAQETQTEFGPLTPSDVDLLVKVRQAGLWEIPTGQQMQQRAINEVVREVGRRLAEEHTELDAIVRDNADQLGVTLPSQPSTDQQGWMQQISAQSGPDYDRTAVNLLRLAHGKVLPVIAQVRSGTRNELIREFATTASTFVTRHHEYLESTGLVDFAALPEPATPAAPPAAAQAAGGAATPPPVLAANNATAGSSASNGPLDGVISAIRDADMSSYVAALVAFAAVIGGGAMVDMLTRGRPGPATAGPRSGQPATRHGPAQPFPTPPSPPAGYGAAPQRRAPTRRRGRGPAAFGVAILALLLTSPVLQGTADSSRETAIAAGFGKLDPAPEQVLALVASREDDQDSDDESRDEDEDRDNSANGDNNGGNNGGNTDNEGSSDSRARSAELTAALASQNQDDDADEENQDGGQDGGQDVDQDVAEDFPGREDAALPALNDFTDIADVNTVFSQPAASSQGSTGSFVSQCGPPEPSLRNSDNWIVAPGTVNGAQHVHDYIGNVSTDANTDAGDLLRSETTCAFEDRSTFFWPVLRDTSQVGPDEGEDGGGLDGNVGEILEPSQVVMQFLGNPTGPVSPMPQLLRVITGDAKAVTNGADNVRAQWTCRGFEDRATTQYPLCPEGSRLLRVLDFPSCWDGENLDSEDHRSHIAFPDEETGACPDDSVAVPQLRMILAYDQPGGRNFALDGFPDQQHHPATDHGDFVNAMPEQVMAAAVECINEGLQC